MDNPATKRRRNAASTVSNAKWAGETLGDFRILKKLGQGGMGEVYLAEQISLKRKVAIKMLRDDVAANETALVRFQAESKTIAKLNHANVVQAHMVGEHDGRHYLVMEYVEGVSLREYIAKKGALDVPLVVSIMRQVANALQRASELGIVHRDIKPENILLTRKGEAKVADFGLSRCLGADERVDLTRAGATVGTPLYMSPEQIEGKDLDCRSDIYSLGVTCYQMLAGKAPFEASTAFLIASMHVHDEPPALEKVRPDVPPALCRIIRKMMAKKPDARYASAAELLPDIARVRQALGNTTQSVTIAVDTPAEETPAEETPAAEVPLWKRPLVLAAAAGAAALGLGAILIVGIVAAWFLHSSPPADPTPRGPLTGLPKQPDPPPDPADALKKTVDQLLADKSAKPSGVETCIDLGVVYLEQKKPDDAEALFRRMTTERKSPSPYYLVGRLGLAVTDELKEDHKASHAKFVELFASKTKDNRVKTLNDYLTKKPEFAAWVNEADSQNVIASASKASFPKGFTRPKTGKFPFRK